MVEESLDNLGLQASLCMAIATDEMALLKHAKILTFTRDSKNLLLNRISILSHTNSQIINALLIAFSEFLIQMYKLKKELYSFNMVSLLLQIVG